MNAKTLIAVLACSASSFMPAGAQTVAFTGATLWDGTGAPAIHDATLLVRDGRIVAVGGLVPPGDATVVDLSGRFVIPGMVNTHGHVTGYWADASTEAVPDRMVEDLRLYARYGGPGRPKGPWVEPGCFMPGRS